VVVRFVDIGGIVDHHYLNVLFILNKFGLLLGLVRSVTTVNNSH